MRLEIDLTGSTCVQDELACIEDASLAVLDLLAPDGTDLDHIVRNRLTTLLRILSELRAAALHAAFTATPS